MNGALDVDTGDGSVTVDGKVAGLRARSGDGGVSVRAAPGSATAGDWTITTGDGSIALELPDGFNADLDAHAGDGSVHVEGITLSNVTGRDRPAFDPRSARIGRPRGARAHRRRLDLGEALLT